MFLCVSVTHDGISSNCSGEHHIHSIQLKSNVHHVLRLIDLLSYLWKENSRGQDHEKDDTPTHLVATCVTEQKTEPARFHPSPQETRR